MAAWKPNASAARFYERLGGTVVGERVGDEYGFTVTERIYGWEDSSMLFEE